MIAVQEPTFMMISVDIKMTYHYHNIFILRLFTEDCPCLNDGLCKKDHNDNNRCICKPGFFGPLCENGEF